MKLLNRLFIALTVASLATTLISVSAHAGGLAFDRAGNLFVADDHSHSIFKFTPDGVKSTFATGLRDPRDVAFDGAGNLFVSDQGSHSIFKFTPDGKKSTFATGLSGVAVDHSGNLFASDNVKNTDNYSIFKFTPDGVKSTFASGLSDPIGLACDGAGNLFVSDIVKSSIFKFTPDGNKSTFAAGLKFPRDLAFDGKGDLFVSVDAVADDNSHAILKFSPDGTQSTFASGLSANDLAFDGAGNLFVSTGHTLVKFDRHGTKSTFASDGISPDKKWEYRRPDEGSPKILKAGTSDVVGDLDVCEIGTSCGETTVLWAPDSKRLALFWGQGRERHTALYQLNGEKWNALKSPGEDDKISDAANEIVASQLKKKGLSEKTQLRFMWWTVKPDRWVDSNMLIVYASMAELLQRKNLGFAANLLFTLKFDDAGDWKIVKTHRMSAEEIDNFPPPLD